jgi:hypothetical protein
MYNLYRKLKLYIVFVENQGITEVDKITTTLNEAQTELSVLKEDQEYLIDQDDPEFRQSINSAWIEIHEVKIKRCIKHAKH